MKKLLLIAGIALFGSISGQVKMGINSGLAANFASVKNGSTTVSNNEMGYYAGIFMEIGIPGPLKIQSSVNYVDIKNTDYIQVPVMLKYYFVPKFNFQVGPQFAFLINNVPSTFNKTNFGIAAGLGIDIAAGLFAEGRYAYQLNDAFKNPPANQVTHFNIMNIGLGYRF